MKAAPLGLAALRVAARLAGAARQGLVLGALVGVEKRSSRAALRTLRRRIAIEIEIIEVEIQIARAESATYSPASCSSRARRSNHER